MIGVNEAEKLIRDHTGKLPTEELSLYELVGRVLAQPVHASRNQPSFDRVCMDGIAISFKALEKTRQFKIESMQKAGEAPHTLSDELACIEIMTGASLPEGCDTVIPYERFEVNNGVVTLEEGYEVRPRQNVHFKAHDYGKGNLLISEGLRLTSAHVALIASQGHERVSVYKNPRVVIISTGDELIEPGRPIEDWQVYSSNSYAMKSELRSFGLTDVDINHFNDDRDEIYNGLHNALSEYDMVILSGGVSAGKYDYVDKVMGDLKVSVHFHKIAQRPGKPMLFGTAENGVPVYGLPGNPNAALICLRRYVINSLFPSKKTQLEVVGVNLKPGFTSFLPVLKGQLVKGNGSGDFYSLSKSDGFIEASEVTGTYDYYPWGSL